MAGLTAARRLKDSGWDLVLVDKSSGPGGRMATRRIGESRFDSGAQFFTVRDPRFRAAVERWEAAGIAAPWFSEGGHIRYRGVGGMNAIPRHLAAEFRLLTEIKIVVVEYQNAAWSAIADDGQRFIAEAVLLTPPVPQSLALLPPDIIPAPQGIDFAPCLALLVTLEGPGRVPAPGYVRPEQGPVEWLADNTQKGISSGPAALTIHARADFSRNYLDAPEQEVSQLLLDAAEPWLGLRVTASQLKRWKYSKPTRAGGPMCLFSNTPGPLAIAGDAFAGGRVEGAFLSGLAAAEALLKNSCEGSPPESEPPLCGPR